MRKFSRWGLGRVGQGRLKGTFADLSRGFFRVFGRTEMTILPGFTVAGFNADHPLSESGRPCLGR